MLKRWVAAAALLAAVPSLRALEGKLVFTLAPNVADEFAHIMPYRPPHVPTVGKCVRNQPVMLHLMLVKPAVDKDGKVLVEVESIKSIEPDGKAKELVEVGKPLVALQGVRKTDRDFYGVMLSNISLAMTAEDTDPLGKTRMTVKLRDRGDGSVLELSADMELVEKLPGEPEAPMSSKQMDEFFTKYYQSPAPENIPAAFAAFLRFDEENVGKNKTYDPLMWLCGFAELYKLNPQLRSALAKGAAGYSAIHKQYVALILAEAGAKDAELKDADPEVKKLFAKARGKKTLSFDTVTHPAQLDALWLRFMVTGEVESIRRLVNELRKRDDVMTVDEVKKLGRQPTPEEFRKFMNGIIGQAAEWSLASNAKQHKLVAYYLEAMLMRKQYPDPGAAAKLGGMLLNAGVLERAKNPAGKTVLRPVIGKPKTDIPKR